MADKFITIATYNTPAEAEMAKNRLEASGIVAFLMDEEAVGMVGYLSNAMGGVKLLVESDQRERAEDVLAGEEKDEVDDRISAVPLPPEPTFDFPEEEIEAEEPTATGDALASRAWRASVLGLFLCPPILHIYAASVLLQYAFSDYELSDAGKRKLTGSTVILTLVSLACLAIFLGVLFR